MSSQTTVQRESTQPRTAKEIRAFLKQVRAFIKELKAQQRAERTALQLAKLEVRLKNRGWPPLS